MSSEPHTFNTGRSARHRLDASRRRERTNATGSAAATSRTTSVIGAASDPVAVAVGDVACPAGDTTNDCRQAATASLAASEHPGAVLMLGDAQYNSGLTSEYLSRGAYNDTWGQFNSIVHPVPGNHDYTASTTAAGPLRILRRAAELLLVQSRYMAHRGTELRLL